MTEARPAISDACADPLEALLPWYVTGTLDAEDHAAVEVHLATCSICRGALAEERALRDAVVALPIENNVAWQRFKQTRFEAPPRRSTRRWVFAAVARYPGRAAGLAAAQAAVVLLVFGMATSNLPITDDYRGLSNTAVGVSNGNAIIVFRPSTTEGELRRVLAASQATIVGGPTPTDGYILQLPQAARTEQIAALRREPTVLLIEAIDGPAS